MRGWIFGYICFASAFLVPKLARAQPVIDGVVDAGYGSPLAEDPADYNSLPDALTRLPQWDLRKLYLTHDADFLYVAFTVSGDVSDVASGEKSFLLYIDTTGDGAGATSDAWTRNIVVAVPHRPEFSLNSWIVPGAAYSKTNVELWQWGGTAWAAPPRVIEAAALRATIQGSVIEWKVSRQAIGNPAKIWVELLSSGSGKNDNAQDTINDPVDDWNAPTANQWTALATVKCSTRYDFVAPTDDASVPDPDLGVPDRGLLHDSRAADLPASDGPRVPDGGTIEMAAEGGARDAGDASGSDWQRDMPFHIQDARMRDSVPADATLADRGRTDWHKGADAAAEFDGRGGFGDYVPGSNDEGCGCAARGQSMAANAWPLMIAFLFLSLRRRRSE